MQNIITLMLILSALSIVVFLWITMFKSGDKTEKIMVSCIFIPLMIALILVVCGAVWEMISA